MGRRCRPPGRIRDAQCLLGGLAAACLAGVPAQGQCQYEVTVIYAPGCATSIIGTAISHLGHVAGYYNQCGGGSGKEAFVWRPETGVQTLQRPGGVSSALAWDINDAGQIVGTMTTTEYGFVAFVYEQGAWTVLPPLPGGAWSGAAAVSNDGKVVGQRSIGPGVNPHNAFIWSQSRGFLDLGVMSGPNSSATAISGGHVAGWTGSNFANSVAFLWQEGNLTSLGPVPGGFTSVAFAVTDDGIVVGSGKVPMEGAPVGATRAFRWEDGQFTLLGSLPDHLFSRAHDISPDGLQIVGSSWSVDGNPNISHAFIWQNGVLSDLNALIAPGGPELVILAAGAVNGSGFITGAAHLQGNVVAVLLRPVGPPLGDINIDCRVDAADLMILIDHFAQTHSPADLNDDGIVNVLDLIILLLNWG